MKTWRAARYKVMKEWCHSPVQTFLETNASC